MPFHVSRLILAASLGCGLLCLPGPARAADEVQTAEVLVKLFKAGRTVVSEHQAVINDASKGDKGFTPAYFVDRLVDKFREQTKIDLRQPPDGAQTRLLLTLVESGREVVAEAQPVINKQGVAFKGFLPAVWARKTGERFTQKTGLRLKLTASVWRYPGNKPDEFEADALRILADPGYPKGKEYSKTIMVNGRPVFRTLTPEYAAASCLACHGQPKGERDITGGKKEGYKEGDLAGAISLMIPIR
jgi:general secretion pathway protein A